MSYEHVKNWRHKMREYAIKAFNGECGICGYNKCPHSLEFHHINPSNKDFTIGSSNIANWSKIVIELRKCVMVCSNCHRELHYGFSSIESVKYRFNETYTNWIEREKYIKYCEACGNETKSPSHKYCSDTCRDSRKNKVEWNSIDLSGLLDKYSYEAIGRMYNVTGASVKKRAKKIGLA